VRAAPLCIDVGWACICLLHRRWAATVKGQGLNATTSPVARRPTSTAQVVASLLPCGLLSYFPSSSFGNKAVI
jgi:hypothetical protein